MVTWGHRALWCALLVLGCLVAGVPSAAAGTGSGPGSGPVAPQAEEPSLNGYDGLRVHVSVHDNGSATWTLEYQYHLDGDENASDEWDDLRRDVEDRPGAYVGLIEERWSATAADAAAETDRNMSTSNFRVGTDRSQTPEEFGYVRFTFEWDSFAHVAVNRIEIGDALSEFELGERTQLIVSWPEAYTLEEVRPSPDDQRNATVVWNGDETEFLENDEPYLELLKGDPETTDDDAREDVPLSWMAGGVAALAVVGAVGWWIVRERGYGGPEPTPESDAEAATDGAAEPDGPPPELLSNEERVLRLLEERGGRMKQQEVVSELGWTEAKTSQVVSGLREEGAVEVFRIGRENVLTLPDDE
ncbi:helix-turn-helix transcriptional regulator [Salinilacihabitans rarus]|uniref:helix-turn-helix transcriptional regulator n=1 Tax=Salinilacihabitans rarus TaxID=2961596 RepID=UPI0020C8A576|nr:hypothetical protein [Salinilacihabitans rarus]